MRKILASDYDQTFYLSDDDIETNKTKVNEFMDLNNLFVIATGRSYFDFHNKLDIYKFNYNYAILNHGATIIDNKNNVLSNISIVDNIVSKIKKDLDLENSLNYFCCSGLDSRVDFEYKNITKINVKYKTKECAMEKVKSLNEKYGEYVNVYYIPMNSIEIISNKIDKASAIGWLAKLIGVDYANIYTIGDGHSDLEMIKKYKGCCMKDSIVELKDCAIMEYSSVSNMIEDILSDRL